MAKFKFTETINPYVAALTARLGSAAGSANYLDDKEVGKFVKLVGDSQYNLAVAGDPIEGHIVATEAAPLDDFSIGSVQTQGRKNVVLDGLQATPGVGAIAIGDYVVVGTVVAKGTALTADAKVCKATDQPGVAVVLADNLVATINAGLVKVAAAEKNAVYAWRLVSASGTAVGSTGVIERVAL